MAAGHGITDLMKLPTPRDEATEAELTAGVGPLWQKIAIWRPAAVVFIYKRAANACAGRQLTEPWGHLPGPATAAATQVAVPAQIASATTPPARTPSSAPSSAPSSSAPSAESGSTTPTPKPALHFATPEAAMRYLAAAYNRNDLPALKKVTNEPARAALVELRKEATNLQLTGCSRQPRGDYVCSFRHDFPAHRHRAGHGQAASWPHRRTSPAGT